jgi:hypothetical protein
MKTLLTLLFCATLLTATAIDPPGAKARTIYCHNQVRDTVEVVLAMHDGVCYRAMKAWPVAPGLDTLITGVYAPEFVWYARYPGRNREDYQYNGPDAERYRFTPPTGNEGDRLRADVNGKDASEWVFGFPVSFAPEDVSYTIVITEPSYCKGRSLNGYGRVFNFMEFMDATRVDGYPEGKFTIAFGDTTIKAAMVNKLLDGPCTVVFGKKPELRRAKGSFVAGAMHGLWVFEDHTRNWSFRYNYNMGVLEGWQVQRIDGVESKAYFVNGVLDPTRTYQTLKSSTRKR